MKIVDKVADFSSAWLRLITDSLNLTEQNSEVTARLKVCSTCEHRKDFRCGVCGCPLSARSRSKYGCPKDYWSSI